MWHMSHSDRMGDGKFGSSLILMCVFFCLIADGWMCAVLPEGEYVLCYNGEFNLGLISKVELLPVVRWIFIQIVFGVEK